VKVGKNPRERKLPVTLPSIGASDTCDYSSIGLLGPDFYVFLR